MDNTRYNYPQPDDCSDDRQTVTHRHTWIGARINAPARLAASVRVCVYVCLCERTVSSSVTDSEG